MIFLTENLLTHLTLNNNKMKRYEGNYATFTESVWCDSLLQLQEHIENSGGYEGNPDEHFRDYETAWIYEYNIIGRNIASYHFSMLDKKWHKRDFKISNWLSWNKAKFPFKQIAQWLLDIFGYKKKHFDFVNKFVQQQKIDSLYGK